MTRNTSQALLIVVVVLAVLGSLPVVYAAELPTLFAGFQTIIGAKGLDFYNGNEMFFDSILALLIFVSLSMKFLSERIGKPGAVGIGIALAIGLIISGFRFSSLAWFAVIILFVVVTFLLYSVIAQFGSNKLAAFATAYVVAWLLLRPLFPDEIIIKFPDVFNWLGIFYSILLIVLLFSIFRLFGGLASGGGFGGGGSRLGGGLFGGSGGGGLFGGGGGPGMFGPDYQGPNGRWSKWQAQRVERAERIGARVQELTTKFNKPEFQALTQSQEADHHKILRDYLQQLETYLRGLEQTVMPYRFTQREVNSKEGWSTGSKDGWYARNFYNKFRRVDPTKVNLSELSQTLELSTVRTQLQDTLTSLRTSLIDVLVNQAQELESLAIQIDQEQTQIMRDREQTAQALTGSVSQRDLAIAQRKLDRAYARLSGAASAEPGTISQNSFFIELNEFIRRLDASAGQDQEATNEAKNALLAFATILQRLSVDLRERLGRARSLLPQGSSMMQGTPADPFPPLGGTAREQRARDLENLKVIIKKRQELRLRWLGLEKMILLYVGDLESVKYQNAMKDIVDLRAILSQDEQLSAPVIAARENIKQDLVVLQLAARYYEQSRNTSVGVLMLHGLREIEVATCVAEAIETAEKGLREGMTPQSVAAIQALEARYANRVKMYEGALVRVIQNLPGNASDPNAGASANVYRKDIADLTELTRLMTVFCTAMAKRTAAAPVAPAVPR